MKLYISLANYLLLYSASAVSGKHHLKHHHSHHAKESHLLQVDAKHPDDLDKENFANELLQDGEKDDDDDATDDEGSKKKGD